MNICFVQTAVYPIFNTNCKKLFGGSEVQMYLIGRELSRRQNFNISFLVGDYNQNKKETYENISVYRGITPSKNFMAKIFDAIKLIINLHKINPDVVVCRSANAGIGIVSLYATIFGKKFIYMCASDIDVDGGYKSILGTTEGFLYAFGLKKAHSIICQSDFQKRKLKKYFNRDSIIIKSSYHIDNKHNFEKKYVLWVGRCHEIKNPEAFLYVAEKNPDKKFVIICQLADDSVRYENLVKRSRKIKNIQFIPHVPFNEIDTYFKKSLIIVNTSDFEGFPNTFIQAAKYNTPIVSLNSNPDNFLDVYECGFCANGDMNKLNTYVDILMNDFRLYSYYSDNAYVYAKENHDIKKNIEKFEEVIKNITY
ncbi:hypothetical protein COB64_00555 [Candidatus Wolfebacteria bacterium]|nr:MAG: hypothetical protein COB64_00555 [Candidatus Wolfebacteria bacterium]